MVGDNIYTAEAWMWLQENELQPTNAIKEDRWGERVSKIAAWKSSVQLLGLERSGGHILLRLRLGLFFSSTSAEPAWALLHSYLNKHEDKTSRYHKCVACKLLAQGFQLPSWFTASYKASVGTLGCQCGCGLNRTSQLLYEEGDIMHFHSPVDNRSAKIPIHWNVILLAPPCAWQFMLHLSLYLSRSWMLPNCCGCTSTMTCWKKPHVWR